MKTVTRRTMADNAQRLALQSKLSQHAGRPVAEVRLTPYGHGRRTWYCVMALDADRREVPLPKGAARIISCDLRAAFPAARWSRAQDYDATTGVLAEHVPNLPASLRDGAL
ncbi:hypothetical protein ACIOWI_29520 [Streptomyces sp. NPDC087659]|uniref:hypothetical protein n=1 Tax=Streptomyces sp. NPDC087659 TaxID=3365801 RepID=UPI00383028F4